MTKQYTNDSMHDTKTNVKLLEWKICLILMNWELEMLGINALWSIEVQARFSEKQNNMHQ